MTDSDEAIARDVAAVGRLCAVPALLRVACESTGMGFAVVARVSEATWTACAVHDQIDFGLKPGSRLDVHTTLCMESRAARQPVVIDHASQDAAYWNHATPRMYNFESYIAVPIVLQDGRYFGNLCALDPKPARVSDPKIVTMFTLFAELISLQLHSEARQQAAESALSSERAAAELRELFIAVLGHDLRNPLMAVGATAEVLEQWSEPEVASLGRRLSGVTQRMARLIDDVMDFARARLGDGIWVARRWEADLATGLHDVLDELRGAHPGRDIVERFQIGTPVYCDRGRVQQLLSNLAGNALVHGAPGRPIVAEAFIEGHCLVLTVTNDGDPIAREHLGKLFEPFWRLSGKKDDGGLGLGLYICSQIVKAHGGTLHVTSSAEEGTGFVVRLPLAPEKK